MHPEWRRAAGIWPIDLSGDRNLRKSFDLLRTKWGEIPTNRYGRGQSIDLLALGDPELLSRWSDGYNDVSTGKQFAQRGWYHTLYRDMFRGRKVLDVGCGFAFDTIHYAEHGAIVTFLDVVEANVRVVERICKMKGLRDVSFCYMPDLDALEQLPVDYDVIYCCGSLIHSPIEVTRMEAQALLRHLLVGGRWIELGYPRIRWEREGRLLETEWGLKTDGGAPWVEWHDLAKLDYLLAPSVFDTVLYLEFHNADFNWFDLIRRS